MEMLSHLIEYYTLSSTEHLEEKSDKIHIKLFYIRWAMSYFFNANVHQ